MTTEETPMDETKIQHALTVQLTDRGSDKITVAQMIDATSRALVAGVPTTAQVSISSRAGRNTPPRRMAFEWETDPEPPARTWRERAWAAYDAIAVLPWLNR
jgi:hypothetical protein